MQQPDLLDLFVVPLEKARIAYMVTGSVASTLYGEPRLTHDVDIVVTLRDPDGEFRYGGSGARHPERMDEKYGLQKEWRAALAFNE